MQKILIVDDHQDILDVMQVVLQDEGYKVRTSLNGSFLNTIHTNMPDLIFLDVLLSGEDGRDICRALKSDEQTKHITVVLISAHIDAKTAMNSCGADGFLAKPFRLEEVRGLAKKYLSPAAS